MKLSQRFNTALIIGIFSFPVVWLIKWYFEYKSLAIFYLNSDKILSAPPAFQVVASFELIVTVLAIIGLGLIILEYYPKFLDWLDKKDYEDEK